MCNAIRILQEIQSNVAQEIVFMAHGYISHSTVGISFFFFFFFPALHVSHVLIPPLQDCNFYHDDLADKECVGICSHDQKLLEI